MTTPAYPEDLLPLPQLNEYALQPVDNTITTETSTGLTIQRLAAPNAPTRMTAVWRITSLEAAMLEGWWNYTGLGYWTMPIDTPNGYSTHTVRFIGKLGNRHPYGQGTWEIQAAVEVRARSEVTSEQMAVLLDYPITDLEGGVAIASATPWHPYILQTYTNLG